MKIGATHRNPNLLSKPTHERAWDKSGPLRKAAATADVDEAVAETDLKVGHSSEKNPGSENRLSLLLGRVGCGTRLTAAATTDVTRPRRKPT